MTHCTRKPQIFEHKAWWFQGHKWGWIWWHLCPSLLVAEPCKGWGMEGTSWALPGLEEVQGFKHPLLGVTQAWPPREHPLFPSCKSQIPQLSPQLVPSTVHLRSSSSMPRKRDIPHSPMYFNNKVVGTQFGISFSPAVYSKVHLQRKVWPSKLAVTLNSLELDRTPSFTSVPG